MSGAWAAALSFALRLGLTPEAFWRLSLAEWLAVLAPLTPAAPFDRAAFQALSARYPDNAPSAMESDDDHR